MLNENFRDMLCALNDTSVEYLLVGAYALAAHGSPRDIDFWVRADVDNAKRVWTGVEFAQAWNSRLIVKIDGMSVPVLGLNDLLTNKLSTGREKDLADIPTIKRLLG